MSTNRVPSGTAQPILTGFVRRILVVDDDQGIRHLNTVVLRRGGYEVEQAEDGAAAWEALESNCYDLLLTDHSMPKVSGVELIRKLRATHKKTPVILVSGLMPKEELSQHPWLQIEAVLFKPYGHEELLSTVGEVLRESEARRNVIASAPPNGEGRSSSATGLRL